MNARAQAAGAAFVMPRLPLLVFTDLDGTLLDHDDYGFEPALPALQRLRKAAVPLIPTTSKTLAEVAELNRDRLHNPHPCIVENGSGLCLPPGYLDDTGCDGMHHGYRVQLLGAGYHELVAQLQQLRQHHGFRFRGFNDMSSAEVARATGLDAHQAACARRRLSSEPLLWQDSAAALVAFREQLAALGLHLTRGGRFWHVMGDTDKAIAMARLCQLYRGAGFRDFTTVALGDGPNDAGLLAAADIAVIIPRKDGGRLDCRGRHETLLAPHPGPAGWNAVLQTLLDRYATSRPADAG